ncbi:cupin domain-containing protein [Litoreibacter janthinus]|uniref:Cupin domain-containing protein n=1 Tax=Litoreibacter janthinus TaxID=670154 RepID=A0A1I6GX39_9RHOB|nr:cupin domain-containing protein [Litoreibacter janthinus]SFR46641.1 Cupin domain-containing protein [Litoreibacter janthinus]
MTHPVVPTDPGVTRQVLAENPDLMMVAFRFEAGAEGKLHDHPHVQATYVETGRFTFSVDGTEHDLGPGDSLVIPSGARHGCVCVEAGALIDTFTPRRDDFL